MNKPKRTTGLRATFEIDLDDPTEMSLARFILSRFKTVFAVTKPNNADLETILQGRKLGQDHGKPTVVRVPVTTPQLPVVVEPKQLPAQPQPTPYGVSYNGKVRVTPPCAMCDSDTKGDWWCCPTYIHCARTSDGPAGLRTAMRSVTPVSRAKPTVVTQKFAPPTIVYKIKRLVDRKMPMPQFMRDKLAGDVILLDNPEPRKDNTVCPNET